MISNFKVFFKFTLNIERDLIIIQKFVPIETYNEKQNEKIMENKNKYRSKEFSEKFNQSDKSIRTGFDEGIIFAF